MTDLSQVVRAGKLSEFTQDPHNANKGTERGGEMVRQSVQSLGMGRSLLVDKNGYVIAGNKTQLAAIDSGLDDAIVVQTDGKQSVIVQRVDLDLSTDPRAKQLAIADNRTAELGLSWDYEVLEELSQEIDLGDWFTGDEMAGWDSEVPDFEPVGEDEQGRLDQIEPKEMNCVCPSCGHEFVKQS